MTQNEAAGKADRVTVLNDPVNLVPHIGGEKRTIVLFEMTTCPYCRMFEERFLAFSRERGSDFEFLRVTLDDPGNPLWATYAIRVVPQIVVFAGGQIVSRLDSLPFVGITKKNWAKFCDGL
jgi:hypothetical protein